MVEDLKNTSYVSISTDSTNHGNIKVFPIVVQYFDHTQDGIQVKLLDMQDTKNKKSETVSELIVNVTTKYNLEMKITVLSADNTNTNFGGIARRGNENVFAHLKNKVNPELIGIGCPAHMLSNGAHHGLDQFALFDIDSMMVKIFNFFSIYTVRTNEFKDFCEFVETEYKNLLSHSKTRWLSLFPAVERVLKLFSALKSYFLSQENPPKIIANFF